ncbi:MAG TPA: DegQ family serine endoprotease [Steroidobacteraceae bacterium]|nr:DegQ family serine endoprotease [Steroidobacteraceae bacterium]
MRSAKSWVAGAAAGVFALGAVAGWMAPAVLKSARADTVLNVASAATKEPSAPPASGPIPLGSAPNYRAIVAQNRDSVVGITTAGEMKVASEQPFDFSPFGNEGDDSPFFRFFRQLPRPHGEVPMHAQGSGFIVSSDGLILTNAHVVDGAKEVTVKLIDHREFKAKVLGADKTSDIAVLKIDAHGLPTVRIGNSDQLAVGDYVLAIGAPFGLEETATAGIVSATGRSLPGDGAVPFIQTDAAVNPGNSGGPLFDATGAVVGINSQIYTNSGGYQGVSFAIPINLAEGIERQIVKTGKVEHGRLGVQVQNVNQSLAQSFKLPAPQGALVAEVEPDSAAARAGVKAGDVILKFNGLPIADAGQLSVRVSATAPGEKATLDLMRDGKPLTLTVTVGSASHATFAKNGESAPKDTHLGMRLRPLTPDERAQSGVPGGLVVEEASGHAAEAGIQAGDVVLSVNGTPVNSVTQFQGLVHEHDSQVALLIQRGDSRIFIPVELG